MTPAITEDAAAVLSAVNRNLSESWFSGAQERLVSLGAERFDRRTRRRQRVQLRAYTATMVVSLLAGVTAVTLSLPVLAVAAILLGPLTLVGHALAGREARRIEKMDGVQRDRTFLDEGLAQVGGPGLLHSRVLAATSPIGDAARDYVDQQAPDPATRDVLDTLAKDGYAGNIDELVEVARSLA